LNPTGYGVAEVAGGHGAVELPWPDVGKAGVLQGCGKSDQEHGPEIRHESAEEEKHQQNEQFQSLTDQGSAEGLLLRADPEEARNGHAAHVRQDGRESLPGRGPVARGRVDPEQNDVAGLRVGEDMAARQIAIGVQKAAEDGKEAGDREHA